MIPRARGSRLASRLVLLVLGILVPGTAARPAEFVTPGEMARKSDWIKTNLETARPGLPFSFVYSGRASGELLQAWPKNAETTRIDSTFRRVTTWTDLASGLEVRCVAVDYADFPAAEWTVYFKNCTFPENTEPAATGQGVVSADFSTPTGERPNRARRGLPR